MAGEKASIKVAEKCYIKTYGQRAFNFQHHSRVWPFLEWPYHNHCESCSVQAWSPRRYFTPRSLLTLYKAQIRPCLEYGSHLWRGAAKHSLATLDAIQKRAIKLIGDPALTHSTPWLTEEPFLPFPCTTDTIVVTVQSSWNQLSPLKPTLRETRGFQTLSTPSLLNWIKIEPTLSPNLISLWLPETRTRFQLSSSPRLITFSCLRPASTNTFNSYPAHKIPLFFFFSRWRGQARPLRDATFWCNSFSHQFHWRKKKMYIVRNKSQFEFENV